MSQELSDQAMSAHRHAHILINGKFGRELAEAIPHLRKAADLWGQALRSEQKAEVLMELGRLQGRIDDHPGAVTSFEEALRIFRDTNLKKKAAEAGIEAGLALKADGHPDKAIAYLERALEILRGAGELIDIAMAEMTLGAVLLDAGKAKEAQSRYEAALPVFERFTKRAECAHAREMLASAKASAGDHDGAAADFELAITMKHDQLGDMRGAARTLSRYADLRRRQDRHADAEALYRRALGIHKLRGDKVLQAQTLGNLGTVLLAKGDRSGAITHYRQCIEMSQIAGERAAVAQGYYNLAGVLLDGGDESGAKQELERALVICEELGSRELAARILDTLADFYATTKESEKAQAARCRRVDLLGQLGRTTEQRQALQSLLDDALEREDYEGASLFLQRLVTDCGPSMPVADLSDVRLKQGIIYGRLGEHADAVSALTQALLHAETADDAERTGRVLRHLGQAELQAGASADALAHFRRAVERYRATSDDRNLATSLVGLGNALVQLGQNGDAKIALEEAATLSEKIGDQKGTQTIRKATAGL